MSTGTNRSGIIIQIVNVSDLTFDHSHTDKISDLESAPDIREGGPKRQRESWEKNDYKNYQSRQALH